MELLKLVKENQAKIQTSLSGLVKIILIFSLFYSVYFHLWQILIADIFLLLLIYFPNILKQNYHVHIPREFELVLLIFVIITFFLGSLRGFVIQLFFGIAIGFIGFTIMLILFSNSKFKTNYSLIILFSFSISLAFGLLAEMSKYYLKLYFNYQFLESDYHYSMMNLTLVGLGSIFSSILGFLYMKGLKLNPMKNMVIKFKKKNPNFFIERTDSPEDIIALIKKGENEKLEFKSTLRTNLHTFEPDKKMEYAVLRTIVAFLNSEGGILLIGVSDNGSILGIEKDKFENNDKFSIHIINLVKEKIGKDILSLINFELILIEGKTIMKISCRRSERPIFLKNDGLEYFFIRAHAASTEVTGSNLIEYIMNNFKNN
jgi:hypothetical protein